MQINAVQDKFARARAVMRHDRIECFVEFSQALLPPQVADELLAALSHLGPFGPRGCLRFATVEQAHGRAAIFHFLGPNFERVVLAYAAARFAEWVLVHLPEFKGEWVQVRGDIGSVIANVKY